MTYTYNDATDKLLYSYMSIRLASYLFFFILNLYQTILEGKSSFSDKNKNKSNKLYTRVFIFFSMTLFCCFRVISTSLFFKYPTEFLIRSLPFLFFSNGTASIFLTWIFIMHFWLLIMYSFFVTDEIRIGRTRPINWATGILVTVLIVYQIVISVLGMIIDVKFGQAIGFVILLLVYCLLVFIFGSILLRHLNQHKKDSEFGHYNDMIKKTKILLITAAIVFVLVIIEEIIYSFAFPVSLSNSIQSNFITCLIDISQMVIVMLVMNNFKFSNYILFRKVKTTKNNSSETSTDSSQFNPRKSMHIQQSVSSINIHTQSIDMDNLTHSINSNTMDIVINDSGKGVIVDNNIDFNNSTSIFDSTSNLNNQ